MKFIILILFITNSLFAIECDDSNSSISLPLNDLHEYANILQENINWFSATDKDIDNALCVDDEDFSKNAIQDHFSKLGKELVTKEVFGISLTDHPRKINLLRKLLRTNDFVPQIELTEKQKTCSNVDCLTKSLFGDLADEHLYLLDKYGLNLNSDRVNYTAKWNKEEVSSLMNSLNYIPKQLLPFDTNQTFVRGKRDNPNGSTYANARVYFYDLHFTQTKQMQTYTIFHEIGHNMASEMSLDDSEEWKSLSDWRATIKKDKDNKDMLDPYTKKPIVESWHAGHDHKSTSKYGQTNPAEDFAESFSAYRFNPRKLKEVAPEKYKYMKENIFHGIEYLDESLCKKENSYSFKNMINPVKSELPLKVDDFSVCQESITSLINEESYEAQIKVCAKKLIAQNAIKANIKKNNPELSDQAMSVILNSSELPIDDIEISKKIIVDTKKLLATEVMKSLIKNFSGYASCSEMRDYMTQKLDTLGDKLSDFQYFHRNQDSLNESLENICIKHTKDKGFSCDETVIDFTSLENSYAQNICSLNNKKTIRCSDDPNQFTTSTRANFINLCKSNNLSSPYNMHCDDSLKKIFADIAGLPKSDYQSLKCD